MCPTQKAERKKHRLGIIETLKLMMFKSQVCSRNTSFCKNYRLKNNAAAAVVVVVVSPISFVVFAGCNDGDIGVGVGVEAVGVDSNAIGIVCVVDAGVTCTIFNFASWIIES